MLVITKEYLIHYNDETALPVGLVYTPKDIARMFSVSAPTSRKIFTSIISATPFKCKGVEYDSIIIQEEANNETTRTK